MVATTVILAAVIGTFVLCLGDQVDPPNANFAFDYDADDGDLTITHSGGDGIEAENIALTEDIEASGDACDEAEAANGA